MVVIDVANPRLPAVLDTIRTVGPALQVSIDGLNAFVAEGPAGVEIFKVPRWEAPQSVRVLRAAFAGSVLVQGGRVWIADITPLHGYLQEGPSTLCEARRSSVPRN
jgi:hypothetical protein